MKRLWVSVIGLALAGCVSNATGSARMIPADVDPAVIEEVRGSELARNVWVNQATMQFGASGLSTGVELVEFNRALAFSLGNAGLLADFRGGAFDLAVTPRSLTRLTSPPGQSEMTVEAVVDYRLTDRQTGGGLFSEAISSAFSMPLANEAEAAEVAPRAIEGAIAANFEELIRQLAALRP